MTGHTSQPQQQQSTVSPIATAISIDNISSHTPPPHTNNNNKQPYVVFAPEKSPIFMTSRHRALHCEMDDPSQRLPYIWGRSLTRKTPLEWVKAKFTACFNHQYFDDDAEYIVPLQHSTGGTAAVSTSIRDAESTGVDRHAVHNATTIAAAAASGGNDVSAVSEEGEAVSIDGTCVVDVEAAYVHVQGQQVYREPTPLPKLTIHMSPLRTSVAQLPLDEQTISMLRMSLLLGGGGREGNLGSTNDDDNDKEASPPRFADLLGLSEAGGMRPPSFAFQPAPQQHHAAMSTASSPQKIAAATAKPSSSIVTSSGVGGDRTKPLKQTTVSLSQLLAVASGDAARRTPTSGQLRRHPGNKAMATSKVTITERLSDMKGFASAPNSPRRMRKRKNNTTGMVAGGCAIAIAPPPPPQVQVQARAARVPVVPASAPATPLEKLLKPAVMPRMNKASQARATAVRERLERMASGKNEDINTKKKSTLGGNQTTAKIAATTAPQMNYSQLLDRHNNNNNNLSHHQQQEIALRLSSTTLAMSKLSEQALVAAAAKAAGVDIATYQKSRQQYIQMLSRLAIGLAVDPALLKQSKLPSPPTSSIMSVSDSGSSSGTRGGGTYQAQKKAVVPTMKHLPAINDMHGTTNIQPPLSPNDAYGLKHDYGEGGETARGKVHQRLISLTDVAAASKKEGNVDMNVVVDGNDRGDMIKANRGETEGKNKKMMKTEVSLADLLEKSLREGGSGNGNGGLKVTDSLTFAELEARGITLKDLLRVRVAMP
jgi:hypothetical protein